MNPNTELWNPVAEDICTIKPQQLSLGITVEECWKDCKSQKKRELTLKINFHFLCLSVFPACIYVIHACI